MGESEADFFARKDRERSTSYEAGRTNTTRELFDVDKFRVNGGREGTQTGQQIRGLYSAVTSPQRTEGSLFNFRNPFTGGLGGFASAITQPIVDLPDFDRTGIGLLDGALNVLEQGIEELSSPVGLLAAALVPVTGGTSLGLTGLAGTATRVGSIAAAEALVGGTAVGAASFVNDRLPVNTPDGVRLLANLVAGVGVGGSVGVGLRRSAKAAAADAGSLAAIAERLPSVGTRKLGSMLAQQDILERIARQEESLDVFRRGQQGAFDIELGKAMARNGGRLTPQGWAEAMTALRGSAERVADVVTPGGG